MVFVSPVACDRIWLGLEKPVASDRANEDMIAFHLIISAYGFWLPNDPRGSWSDFVAAWELRKFGPATKVNGRHSYAHDPHDFAPDDGT